MRARFDLLTSFRQGNHSVDEWYNAVQDQVSLAKYPPETASILHRDIFWFFLKDEEFVSKTVNDSNIDLDKFPHKQGEEACQEDEIFKSITRHINVTPQVAQINLMRHQRTDHPPSKAKWNSFPTSLNQRVVRGIWVNTRIKDHPTSQDLIQARHIKEEIDVPSVEILNM